MKTKILGLCALSLGLFATSCTDLDEKVYDRVDSSVFYQNEQSVQGAVATVYAQAANSFAETFFMLQELPADQVAWRCWNNGQWGYDEGEKTVLSMHIWSPESKIIRSAWENAWTGIGLANNIINDLGTIDAGKLNMTDKEVQSYIAEVRMLRAWNYYNLFEIWGGALPLNTSVSSEVPGSADPDFDKSCKKIYDFIMTELNETLDLLPKADASNSTSNRMNQGVNRILKARLLLNSEIFIKEDHYQECLSLCDSILDPAKKWFGDYKIVDDYRDVFSLGNEKCPEVVFAFACEDGQGSTNALCNMRNMPFLAYNYNEYFNCPSYDGIGAWNCMCLVPSLDNSVDLYAERYNANAKQPKSFIKDYGDKLGGPFGRMDDRDIRKKPFVYNTTTGKYEGQFLMGIIKSDFGNGTSLTADADRDGQELAYFDQVGTFCMGTAEDVQNSRWGETNSGVRYIKYPMFPTTDKGGFKDIDEVEFRLAEVVLMKAECEMRKGGNAKETVNSLRKRYFTNSDWQKASNEPGPGFNDFNMDWMLSQWGLEYLCEGRRRRTDLRRFDKFTQGQWWFFGRTSEGGVDLPAKRDRKYEWYPLPASAIGVNPGLVQNPNY